MEADRTAFERIDGAAQPNEPGVSSRRPGSSGAPAVRRLSCDGIWAEWATRSRPRRRLVAASSRWVRGAVKGRRESSERRC